MRQDDLADRLDRLERDQRALVQGCHDVADSLELQTELLQKLLDVAEQEPPESRLPDVLERLVAAVNEQTVAINAMERSLSRVAGR